MTDGSAREEEVGPYCTSGFQCDCGRTIMLWWNGGELDWEKCECGVEWWGEHRESVLMKGKRYPDQGDDTHES